MQLVVTSSADDNSVTDVTFQILDATTDQPIGAAKVHVRCLSQIDSPTRLKSNPDGIASYVPPSTLAPLRLRITVRATGYHPYHAAIDDAKTLDNLLPIPMRPGRKWQGRVVDSTGSPVADTRVTTTDAADVSVHGYYYTLFDTRTDSEGRFEFDAVADTAKLRLELSHPDFKTQWFTCKGNARQEFVLRQSHALRGRVLDFRGKPVTDATVIADQSNTTVTTDAEGQFDLGMTMAPQSTVVVMADRLSPQMVSITPETESNDLSLRLLPGRTIRFRVSGPDGRPLNNTQVRSIRWQDSTLLRLTGTSDAEGQITIRNAPADLVEYEFRHPEYGVTVAHLQAENKRHEIELPGRHQTPSATNNQNPELANETGIEQLDIDLSVPESRIMHLCAIDGTVLRPLINDVTLRHRYDRQGTPDVSPDGSTVAFDAWSTNGDEWDDARIIVANRDGSNARDIAWGVIPSLSPDGSHIAYSRPTKHAPADGTRGQSIWTMKSDGTDQKMIEDNYAWGARWTADGRSIVFRGGLDDQGRSVSGNCLRVYDLETETTRNAFSPEESPFSSLHFHLNVSRHGRLAVMNGTLHDGTKQMAVVDIDQGISSLRMLQMKFPHISNFFVPVGGVASFSADDAWIASVCRQDGLPVGHALAIDGVRDPRPFPNLPKNLRVLDPTFTPDGKHLIVSFSP
ncbi:carboxypeptidase regulatory-like domain-containing protein [Rhodopirellula sp. SWK7]|uniref:carboxypeptidase regulatory-like domain-containing protein n=1 Tax=Rhodopirellula sp. SWK7 TaxID=595460 RepID=UPI0002BD7DC1|nr:carboxypeptidase regulatory-like domain-containing protein [Rhodopirellula sp. SWK7]EMI40611.1 peptidase yuxL [Rhodopirellula sp. SWK7]